MASQRHTELSPAELDDILIQMDRKSTRLTTNNAVYVFRNYLNIKFVYGDRELERLHSGDSRLCSVHCTFYAEVRTQKGETYTKNPL